MPEPIDFEQIKSKIKGFKHLSFIPLILDQLVGEDNGTRPTSAFWKWFLLLKWSYIHSTPSRFKRKANLFDLKKLYDLESQFEAGYQGVDFTVAQQRKRFFKVIAYQQFFLQDHYHNSVLFRQYVLYVQLTGGPDINQKFEELTDMTIPHFLEYCFITYAFLHPELVRPDIRYDGQFTNGYEDVFRERFSQQALDAFLQLLTITNQQDMESLHRLKKEILQTYETNFFTVKPFIYFDNKYRIIHRNIFGQTLSHFIYEFLKANWDAFPDAFGRRMEKYVELGIQEINTPYASESVLKKKYGTGKVVDFLIEPDVLIEVKATELHPRSGVGRVAEVMQDDLKSSTIKGYTQLLSIAHAIDPKRAWFGIIITYKEMFLGFGADAWEEFMQPPIEEFLAANHIEITTLPPENLFFITLSDWDHIVQAVKDGTATLLQILQKAKEGQAIDNIAENVLLMAQVLSKHFKVRQYTLSYHDEARQSLDILPTQNDE